MAGTKILNISDLSLDEVKLKKPHSDDFNNKQKVFIRRFGQFYIPIVAKVSGVYRIVDGLGFVKNYQEAGNEIILCNLIADSDISEIDFVIFRIFFNIKRSKLEHLSIAELIGTYFKTNYDFRQLANKTNISEDDIEKYSKLLDFDWEEFAKKPLNESSAQMSFFDMFTEDDGKNDIF